MSPGQSPALDRQVHGLRSCPGTAMTRALSPGWVDRIMPQGVQHRIALVGVTADVEPALRSALRSRQLEPDSVYADLAVARQEAFRHPGETHLFLVQLAANQDPGLLAALTGQLPGQPVIALLPPGSDLTRLLAAQRAGAAQV